MSDLNRFSNDLRGIPNDPVEDEVEEPLQPELTPTDGLNLGMQKNPDAYSKVVDIADKAGLHPDLVEGKEAEIDRDNQFKVNEAKLNEKAQSLRDAFTNPTFAGQAHDDIDVLDKIITAVSKPFENFGASMAVSLKERGEGVKLNTLESSYYNPILGFDPYQEEVESLLQSGNPERVKLGQEIVATKQRAIGNTMENLYQLEKEGAELTPKGLSVVQEGVRAGAQSFIEMMAAIGVGAITRTGMIGTLGTMYGSTYSGSYANARTGGLSPEESSIYAHIQSTIEVGTEVMPLGALEKIYTGTLKGTLTGKGDLTRKIIEFMIKEGLTEQVATLGQSLTDIGAGLDKEIENAETLSDKIDLQLRRQAVTAVAVVVGGGAQVGVATAAGKAIQALKSEADLAADREIADQNQLDQITEIAESSKLKDRSPEAFKQYVNDAAPDKKVFIDAAQAKLYLQEVGEEAVKADPILQTIADQVNQAEAINGSVELTMGEFAADMVGSEHIEALRPLMTLNEDTVAPFRQEAEAEQREHMLASIVAEAEKSGDLYAEAREIYETHQAELIKTGRIDKRAAKHLAEFLPAYATVVANDPANVGLSITEVYDKMGLKVEGPFEERKDQVEQGRAELNREQDFSGVKFTQDRVTPSGENVTITRNVQREWDQTSKRRDVVNKLMGCLGG